MLINVDVKNIKMKLKKIIKKTNCIMCCKQRKITETLFFPLVLANSISYSKLRGLSIKMICWLAQIISSFPSQ